MPKSEEGISCDIVNSYLWRWGQALWLDGFGSAHASVRRKGLWLEFARQAKETMPKLDILFNSPNTDA